MADTKLSALTALAETPADADQFYINDDGVSKKIAYSTIKAAFATAAQDGDVTGPASSTDHALARFDGGGGKTLQDSTATLSDAGALTLDNGTLTTDAPVLDVSQTWNDAAVAFTAIKANVTDTASAAASNLLDLQVGGVSKLQQKKNGNLGVTVSTGETIWLEGSGSASVAINSGGRPIGIIGSQVGLGAGSSPVFINGGYLGFADGKLRLYQDADDTLAQRRGHLAQTYRLYNTWTNASNYERLAFTWSSNLAEIKTEALGSGTLRDLSIGSTGGKLAFLGATPVARSAHVADADTAHALDATFSDTEVEAALNALGTKLNSVLAALRAFGLLSTS